MIDLNPSQKLTARLHAGYLIITLISLMLPAFGAQAGVALTSLYSFTGGTNGGNPAAGLVQGSDGNFYGTTIAGGLASPGEYVNGTVFKISTNGVLTTMYAFDQ